MKIERENEEKMYSTFLQFKWMNNHLVVPDDPWRSHRELQQNARRIIQLTPTANERNLAQHWINEYQKQPDSLARLHLSAYFEESCFWVAHKLAQKRSGKSSYFYLFQEYFQIARVIAAKPENILQGYDPSRSNSVKSVKNWSQLKLATAISDMTGEKTYSDAGLLRRQTKTSLKRALEKEGVSSLKQEELTNYLLAWQCFQAVYTPSTSQGNKQLLWPDVKQWEKIAAEYNEQAINAQLLPSMTAQNIDKLLKFCVKALRNINQIEESELDELTANLESTNTEGIDAIIEAEEAAAQQQEIAQKRELFFNAFTVLSPDIQIMFMLWHGLDFNQGDVGELFGIPRNQIANKFKSWRKSLLKDLFKQLGQKLTSQELENKSKLLDDCLQYFCKEAFNACLRDTLDDVCNVLQIPKTDVNTQQSHIKQQLENGLRVYVKRMLNDSGSKIDLADRIIAQFVEEWLTKDKTGVE